MQEPIKIKFQLTREDYVTSLRLFNAKMPLAWVAYLIVGVLLTYFALTFKISGSNPCIYYLPGDPADGSEYICLAAIFVWTAGL